MPNLPLPPKFALGDYDGEIMVIDLDPENFSPEEETQYGVQASYRGRVRVYNSADKSFQDLGTVPFFQQLIVKQIDAALTEAKETGEFAPAYGRLGKAGRAFILNALTGAEAKAVETALAKADR